MNEPIGPVRILQPGARAAHGVGDGLDRLVLADDALVQPLLQVQQARLLALEHLVDGDAGPLGDDGGHVLLGDLFAQERPVLLGLLELVALGQELLLELGHAAEAQLGGAVQIAAALRQLRLGLGRLDLLLELADGADELFSRCQTRLHLVGALAQLGDLVADRRRAAWPRPRPSPCQRLLLDRERRQPPLDLSIGSGSESISILRRLAASSTRSIALSGSCRPWM